MIDAIISALESEFFRNVSFFSGLAVAMVSIYSARAVAMKKQSSDLVFSSRSDDAFNKGFACLRLQYEKGNVRDLVERRDEDAANARYILNYFEMLSIGIQNGIYDEGILKSNYYSTVISLRIYADAYVKRVREITGKDTNFQEFCRLGDLWTRKPLKKKGEWTFTFTR